MIKNVVRLGMAAVVTATIVGSATPANACTVDQTISVPGVITHHLCLL
jgi:hypothetical protein